MEVSGQEGASDPDSQLAKVVHYLRGQQEILELQLQIEKQEKARLSAKLESAERNLDDARASLTEVRSASSLARQFLT